mgnify:CR=1 FL=1
MDIVQNTAICPIVFEIYERLKLEYGFSDTGSIHFPDLLLLSFFLCGYYWESVLG